MISQAFHGLEAYSGKNKPISLLVRQAISISSVEGEICTSNRLIGNIGVVVDAVHTVAIDGDVWSSVRKDGTRIFSPENNANRAWFADGVVEEKWFYSEQDWTNVGGWSNACLRKAATSAVKNKRYAEYFARKPEVRCVVFRSDAGQLVAKRARVLARALGTVAMPVDEETNLASYQTD